MIDNAAALAAINSTVRTITAMVALGGATFTHKGALQGVTVERAGAAQFFGFGICQKATIKLIDRERALSVAAGSKALVSFGGEGCLPAFYVTETHRDEATNGLSVTAYDAIYDAASITVDKLVLSTAYTVRDMAAACADALGLGGVRIVGVGSTETCFDTLHETGANLEGTETLREVLDDIAEATQTIYYATHDGLLCFKRLDREGAAVYTIDRSRYFNMSSKTNRRLAAICHATELGDNVTAALEESGTTQYVRDNAFWTLRDDVGTLVDAALAAAGGLTINQFECEWRGNYLLELGDKIALETKDGGTVASFLLDDTIEYDGAYRQRTAWKYEDSNEDESNPSNLGDLLKQTYARVDKANKRIELVASETERISVALGDMGEDLADVTKRASLAVTPEQVQISIEQAISDGVNRVRTTTGFTFDEDGMTVSKDGSELSTTVTEDGMRVMRNDEEVLRADNQGVKARNLHATTYLIIGETSRFEDYEKDGESRTGCFWIGPVSV